MKVVKIELSQELIIEWLNETGSKNLPKDAVIIDCEYHYNHIDIIINSKEFKEVGEGCEAPVLNE